MGPLGLSREAATRVLGVVPPDGRRPGRMHGRAYLGAKTVGRVEWEIRERGAGGSDVRLSATVERASPLDRLVLAAGGAWWLRRIFANLLRRLDEAVADAR